MPFEVMLATMTQHRRSGDGDNDGAGSGKTADDEDDEETNGNSCTMEDLMRALPAGQVTDLWTKGEVPDGDSFSWLTKAGVVFERSEGRVGCEDNEMIP
jgi:hypothetical protein